MGRVQKETAVLYQLRPQVHHYAGEGVSGGVLNIPVAFPVSQSGKPDFRVVIPGIRLSLHSYRTSSAPALAS